MSATERPGMSGRVRAAALLSLGLALLIITVSTASAAVDVIGLGTAWQNGSEVLLEFRINNTGSETLSPVNWSLVLGDGTIRDSLNSLTLSAGKAATVFARWNYSGAGNYKANATAWNASLKDTEYLTVRVEGPPTFVQNLTNQLTAASTTYHEITWSLDANCSDPNGDAITYALNDTSLFTIGASDGIMSQSFGQSAIGNHSFTVTCTANGSTASQSFVLRIDPLVDAEARSLDLAFSPANPIPGETVTLSQAVWNRGTGTLSGIRVRFYYDNYTNLIDERNISSIPAGENATVSTAWSHEAQGIHVIRVRADDPGTITETFEGNNEAAKPIAIGNTEIGTIILTASVGSPAVPGALTTVGGTAFYNTTYDDGPVAGGSVTITIQETGATWTTYTLATGSYSKSITAPSAVGNYTVTISVTDGTYLVTQTKTLEVKWSGGGGQPPVQFGASLNFNNTGPLLNETVNVSLSVTNSGSDTAYNVSVQFFGPSGKFGEYNISQIPSGATVTAHTEWKASPVGYQTLWADLWWNGSVRLSRSGTLRVYSPLPDLTTTQVQLNDTTPATGQSIKVTTTVKNAEGGSVTTPFNVTFNNGWQGDEFVSETEVQSLAGKGTPTTLTFSWVPGEPAQTKKVNILTDSNNVITNEYTEANNNLSIDVVVHQAAPDAKPYAIIVSSSEPLNGTSISITANVTDVGELDAYDVVVRFEDIWYNGTGSQVTLIASNTISPIKVGAYNHTSANWTMVGCGSHTIRVNATAANDSDKTNSIMGTSVYVVCPDLATDLNITSQDIALSDEYPQQNELVYVNATVHNIHATNSAANITVVFRLDSTQFDAQVIPSLTAGQSTKLQSNFSTSLIGSHVVHIVVDPNNYVQETTKMNNNATRAVIVVGDVEIGIINFTVLKHDPATRVRVFEAVIKDIGLYNLTDIEWWLDTNDSLTRTGAYNLSLSVNGTARIVVAHNYSAPGAYRPTFYARNQGMTVSSTLNLTIPAIAIGGLTNISLNATRQLFEFRVWNIHTATLTGINWSIDFGDGASRISAAPANLTPQGGFLVYADHNYNSTGQFTVNASATNGQHNDSQILLLMI